MLRVNARIRGDVVFRCSFHLIAALVEWLEQRFD
jgi:hypothetical protein